MSYTIRYTAVGNRKHNRKSGKTMWLVVAIAVVFSALVFKHHIAPGENSVTAAAFAQMADNLKDGERFYDAAQAFCRQILEGADLE